MDIFGLAVGCVSLQGNTLWTAANVQSLDSKLKKQGFVSLNGFGLYPVTECCWWATGDGRGAEVPHDGPRFGFRVEGYILFPLMQTVLNGDCNRGYYNPYEGLLV